MITEAKSDYIMYVYYKLIWLKKKNATDTINKAHNQIKNI